MTAPDRPAPRPTGPRRESDAGVGSEVALRVRGLGKRFGGVHAVAGIDLDVTRGERVSVIGPNGAGKSTLFNLVAGEVRPSAGRVEMFGEDVTGHSVQARARRGLARTFQTSRLFAGLTVSDNLYLALSGRPGGVGRLRASDRDTARRRRATRLADDAGLVEALHTVVGELSHGEQRQLELAMALATDPSLLMLDEPAAGLSPTERRTLTSTLRRLSPRVTLLLIEHDMDIALVIGDRVVVLADGEPLLEGTADEVRSSETVRRVYLGAGSVTAADTPVPPTDPND
ncbi:ABC transporter ATP-binding protein [Spiractinospora alimapuensis]|uniref:ABC transporter ATP-binding protein n=1 Tax=Spiractinospora alimapuensis TaxID=2820884 RepID=UPI001F22BAC9|nr:ABC transporter ATP-binding protein [Spiractinospora alimapuensis]QVQ54890.1 ABC transporter ATP-binding protein [Spiractinospora alimapuensis]